MMMTIDELKKVLSNAVEYILEKCNLIKVVDISIISDKTYIFNSYEEFKNADGLYDYYLGFIDGILVIECHGSGTYKIYYDRLRCIDELHRKD